MDERRFLGSVGLTGLLVSLGLGWVVLQDFPNSGDEWCYLLQARIFAQGQLSVASAPWREFFDVGWMINNGRFYTQHPPGWPVVLASGVLVGMPWLVNPVLGASTLLVIYQLGKRMYTTQVARLAALLTLCAPFFLLHSASYWAHTSSLLTLALSCLGFVSGLERRSRRCLILGGLCGSLSLLIRPLEQLAFLLACGLFCLVPQQRRTYGLIPGLVFGGTHLVGLGVLLGYHTLQNGHPLVTGYHLGYSAGGASNLQVTFPTRYLIDDYLLDLLWWTVPGMLLLAGGQAMAMWHRTQRATAAHRWDSLLLLTCVTGIVVYALVAYPSLVGYGPRYYYSLLFAMVLLAARGALQGQAWISLSPRTATGLLVGVCLVALGLQLPWHLRREAAVLQKRMAFFQLVQSQGIHHAVVFIGANSGDFEPRDLTRNRLDFQGDIVYAVDRGARNRLLMQHYPGRRYWLYTSDATQARAHLQEIQP